MENEELKKLTHSEIEILATKLAGMISVQPRWMKLKQAAGYSSIGEKKLKNLAEDREIDGYPDPDSKRGDWIFDKISIDKYRMKPIHKTNVRIKKILDSIRK